MSQDHATALQPERQSETLSQKKKIIRGYGEQFYANKLYNIVEMDTFLERQKLKKLSQRRNRIPE